MKKLFFTIIALFMVLYSHSQITSGQLNDFQDGTTQGWSNGPPSPNPPVNIPDGGPTGAGDRFLREVSAGGSGAGSRLILFNEENEWQGNYTAANIVSISFHAKNSGTTDLSLRIAMEGGNDTSEMVTTDFVSLPASQTEWILITIPILASDFTVLNGVNSAEEVLADMNHIHIMSNPNLEFQGESIAGTLDLDNIMANPPLAVNENTLLSNLTIAPNPVFDYLHLSTNLQLDYYAVYSITGKLLFENNVVASHSRINFAQLPSGIYLLKVRAGDEQVIKQVVKM